MRRDVSRMFRECVGDVSKSVNNVARTYQRCLPALHRLLRTLDGVRRRDLVVVAVDEARHLDPLHAGAYTRPLSSSTYPFGHWIYQTHTTGGRGLHSSSVQINLLSLKYTETTQRVPQKVLTTSRKVDDCKPPPRRPAPPCP